MNISSATSALNLQKNLAATNASQLAQTDFESVLDQALASGDDKELKGACDELESYMLSMLFKQVKDSMLSHDEDSLIPKGDYVEMFEGTMINALAEKTVQSGGIGISEALYRQMTNSYGAQMNLSSGGQQPVSKADDEI